MVGWLVIDLGATYDVRIFNLPPLSIGTQTQTRNQICKQTHLNSMGKRI